MREALKWVYKWIYEKWYIWSAERYKDVSSQLYTQLKLLWNYSLNKNSSQNATLFPGLFPLKLFPAPPNFKGRSPGNEVAWTGFKPMTSAIPVQFSDQLSHQVNRKWVRNITVDGEEYNMRARAIFTTLTEKFKKYGGAKKWRWEHRQSLKQQSDSCQTLQRTWDSPWKCNIIVSWVHSHFKVFETFFMWLWTYSVELFSCIVSYLSQFVN